MGGSSRSIKSRKRTNRFLLNAVATDRPTVLSIDSLIGFFIAFGQEERLNLSKGVEPWMKRSTNGGTLILKVKPNSWQHPTASGHHREACFDLKCEISDYA